VRGKRVRLRGRSGRAGRPQQSSRGGYATRRAARGSRRRGPRAAGWLVVLAARAVVRRPRGLVRRLPGHARLARPAAASGAAVVGWLRARGGLTVAARPTAAAGRRRVATATAGAA